MQSAVGVFWACDACGGRTVALPVLRKVVSEPAIKALWLSAQSAALGRKRCPTCGNRMCEASASGVQLDVCKVCQFVWFDPREFEQLPALPVVEKKAELPQAAREMVALYEVKRLQEQAEAEEPIETWQHVPAVFGLPVECNSPGLKSYPVLTWSVALAVLVVSIVGFVRGESFVDEFAFIPAQPWRHGGLTSITSFFLHGGIFHLVGNLYFLLVFGDNVEERLGWRRFGLLLLASTIAGDALHALGDPRGQIPCVGASGGISGVIAFYALTFPNARLGLYMRVFYRVQWVQFRAWVGMVIWVLLQGIGAAQQLTGFSNVSALAHIGGAAVGACLWLIWRRGSADARQAPAT